MASTDARPVPRKNTAFRVTFPIYDASGNLDTGASTLDSEVSKDGAAFADATNEAVGIGNGFYYLDLDTGDMSGDTIVVVVKSDEKTTSMVIYPEEDGDYRADARMIRGDTGAADRLLKLAGSQLKTDGTFDTGTGQTTNTFNITATATTDTGQVSNAVWNSLRSAHTVAGSFGESDTGINDRLGRIQTDVDTGLRDTITDLDTGLRDHITNVDTGLTTRLDNVSVQRVRGDTGAGQRFFRFLEKLDTGGDLSVSASVDTGQVNQAVWQGNASRTLTSISDTGLNGRLTAIQNKTDSLTFTVSGQVDANIQSVNDTTVQGNGSSGNEWRPG